MATSVVGPRPGSRGMPATTMTPVETTRSLNLRWDGGVGRVARPCVIKDVGTRRRSWWFRDRLLRPSYVVTFETLGSTDPPHASVSMQTLFDLRASPVQAGGSKFSRMRQLDHGGPEWRGHLSALVVGHPVAGIARLRQVHRALVRGAVRLRLADVHVHIDRA